MFIAITNKAKSPVVDTTNSKYLKLPNMFSLRYTRMSIFLNTDQATPIFVTKILGM